jgi:hypothetical protein
VKSLQFLKPTLATTLAIVLAWLLSVRPAQAGYIVTLQQVGGIVVATGSGPINLTGLTFSQSFSLNPEIRASSGGLFAFSILHTGPTSSSVDSYIGATGPTSFGLGSLFNITRSASSGSGDMVGIAAGSEGVVIYVPTGYVSGTALSDRATYSGTTLAQLRVKPGTYVWKWGTGANQNFTLQTLPAIPPATNTTNISTRASVQTDQGVTIAGFIVAGTDSKTVVLRGLGPTLTQQGVTDPVLADPFLSLRDGNGNLLWNNNDWKDSQQTQIQATGLAPTNDLESAIVRTLTPGNYTAILSGRNGTTGIGLVEVYDVATGAIAELTNVSTRGFVGTGEAVMIGGFITSGGSTQVVVRGLGPTLTQKGVTDPVLADPFLRLFDGSGNLLWSNNDWKDSQQTQIQATGLAPKNDLESAIVRTLAPGNYTAILSGRNGTTGIGLVEVYKLQ